MPQKSYRVLGQTESYFRCFTSLVRVGLDISSVNFGSVDKYLQNSRFVIRAFCSYTEVYLKSLYLIVYRSISTDELFIFREVWKDLNNPRLWSGYFRAFLINIIAETKSHDLTRLFCFLIWGVHPLPFFASSYQRCSLPRTFH